MKKVTKHQVAALCSLVRAGYGVIDGSLFIFHEPAVRWSTYLALLRMDLITVEPSSHRVYPTLVAHTLVALEGV